ncbi:MAG: methyl-accepting chemotaxis protein [Ghiorsea sp.]|nr:methyl-accepting chemotaxis protein [Ghiorsea sp.]
MDTNHVAEIEVLFQAVSSGDFTFRIGSDHPLSNSANHMMQWLDQMQLKELKDKVEFTITGFENTINMAKLRHSADNVAQRTETMASATEEMSITVQMIAEQADKVGEQSEQAKVAVDAGSQSMKQVFDVIHETRQQMNNVTDEVQRLATVSKEIDSLLTTIRKISDQTNLLALNATIEAARAGDAGRGFAVVAGEVKQLSHQTKDAADNIVEKSNGIQESVAAMVTRLSDMSETVTNASSIVEKTQTSMDAIVYNMQQVDESVHGMHHATKEQATASTEIAEGVTLCHAEAKDMDIQANQSLNTTDEMDAALRADLQEFSELKITNAVIELAKSDHMFWKKRLVDMILGRENIDINEVTDHHNCRLGKWYYSNGQAEYGNCSSFKGIEAPHADMHRLAKQAVTKFNAGDISGATQDVETIATLSEAVVKGLEELA